MVERAKPLVGQDVTVRVTSVVITANGRLVFAHVSNPAAAATSELAGLRWLTGAG